VINNCIFCIIGFGVGCLDNDLNNLLEMRFFFSFAVECFLCHNLVLKKKVQHKYKCKRGRRKNKWWEKKEI